MKKEMTAREFLKQMARMCKAHSECEDCPLGKYNSCDLFDPDVWDYALKETAEWATEHPEETLEPVGNGIYFDPKHRIVADELTGIYTFEVTYIDENGGLRGITSEKVLKNLLDADDVKLIRAQQFITKAHEEEL